MGGRDRVVSALLDFTDIVRPVFIETGFGQGRSFRNALAAGFETCISIEIEPHLYWQAVCTHGRDARARIFYGDSADLLPYVIDPLRATTFWLDAHWSGGGFGDTRRKRECPLLEELTAIFQLAWATPPIILIDDAVMFMQPVPPNFDAWRWPRRGEIEALCAQYGYQLDEDGALFSVRPA